LFYFVADEQIRRPIVEENKQNDKAHGTILILTVILSIQILIINSNIIKKK